MGTVVPEIRGEPARREPDPGAMLMPGAAPEIGPRCAPVTLRLTSPLCVLERTSVCFVVRRPGAARPKLNMHMSVR